LLPIGLLSVGEARLEGARLGGELVGGPGPARGGGAASPRYYRLTRDGADLAREALQRADSARARRAAGFGLAAPGAAAVAE
jgi:hypothetical protein